MLTNPKKEKAVVMLAPSFVVDFSYPEIIGMLKEIGFERVVELTFGAKMINREYHKIIENKRNKNKLIIASVCPGITEFIEKNLPKYKKNLIKVDSPMIATAKICRKIYPKHKVCFISPCNFKKIEAEKNKGIIDEVITFAELKDVFEKKSIKPEKYKNKTHCFDKFYNDYTKVYPLSGGLSKTAHLKQVLKPGEEKTIDGIGDVKKFLDNPDKKIRFLDATFCVGGCLGGPCIQNKSLEDKKKKLMHYLEVAKKEKMPEGREGLIEKAKGIKFRY